MRYSRAGKSPTEIGLLAAHPADELLDLDPVQASHDSLAAQPEHGQPLAVEIFPFPPRRGVLAHGPVFKLDAHLVQQLGHRGRLTGSVSAIEDRVSRPATLAVHLMHAMPSPLIKQIDCFDRSY